MIAFGAIYKERIQTILLMRAQGFFMSLIVFLIADEMLRICREAICDHDFTSYFLSHDLNQSNKR